MRRISGLIIHVICIISCATLLTALYRVLVVYVIGNYDPKFGQFGTVKIAAVIAFIPCGVGSIGSGLSLALWIRNFKSHEIRSLAFLTGIMIGIVFALIHKWVLFHAPTIPGYSELAQQIVYFVILGILFNSIAVPIYKITKYPKKAFQQRTG